MMFSNKMQEMINEFASALPDDLKILNQEVKTQLYLYLASWLSEMSLVTKEEFDIQSQVLAKTRAKLEALEEQLAELTKTINQPRE